jgi:polyhydroxybutyrate depolymerase
MRLIPILTVVFLACSGAPPAIPDAGGHPDSGTSDSGVPDAGPGDAGVKDAGYPPLTTDELNVLNSRPYRLVVPDSYDGGSDVPFVVLLHGYTATGLEQDVYFHMTDLAQAKGFLLATPDGLIDDTGQHYWNATDACCGSTNMKPDDVGYLTAIMDDVRLRYRVDPKRVYFVGHSNGGFMSHRMACDRADRIAAIVSLAGAQWSVISRCAPDDKISVLEVHGTADTVIPFDGGTAYGPFPGAWTTVGDWATLNGCGTTTSSGGANLDLDTLLIGAETLRDKYDGCPSGGAVELWTIEGGSHVPNFTSEWGPDFYDWLMAHPKP